MEDEPYITDIDLQPPSPDSQNIPDIYPATHSYNNSPYSSHSDLSYDPSDQAFTNYQPVLYPEDSYDPSDFDNPNSGSSLLMFDDDYHQASSEYNLYTFESYRSPSPGSDNNDDARSRASSTSSNNNFHTSPQLNVTSFENMSFQSPNWGTSPLPKPLSPPRLVIDQPPIIIAPEGDDSNGPRLQVVPATPIGMDGSNNSTTSSFQSTLETLGQAGELHNPWLNALDKSNPSTRSPSPAPTPPAPSRSPSASPQPYHSSPSPTPTPFLFPQPPRSRSKSDTALDPPNWDTMGGFLNAQQQISQPPPQSQSPPLSHMQQTRQDYSGGAGALNSNFTFGQPPSSTSTSTTTAVPNADSNGFLSPDLNTGFTPLRRSKSDTGGRGGPAHHRASRSEDIHPGAASVYDSSSMRLGLGQPGQYLFPPSSHQDFLQSHQQQQFLSPNMSGGSGAGSGRGGMRVPELPHHQHSQSLGGVGVGHYRRSSSGTRSERGTSWERGEGGVPTSTNRVSPYPTPNASPRLRYSELARDDFDYNGGQGQGQGPGGQSLASVSKPNVTTGRTANASHKRRKQEATFVCPVQGCGSTFTRSFNLKGHIRSHNEEKPFQCHWPGCGKGFARQHDCKRHEQLHTNYRPFTCEGCSKQFARMDALNRHLRSEGGADCIKLHEANGGADPNSSPSLSHAIPNTNTNATPNNTSSSSSSSASRSSSSPSTVATTLNPGRGYNPGLGDVGMQMMGLGGMGGGTKMEDGPSVWGVGLSVAL